MFPFFIEKNYAQGLYPFIGRFQRIIFGWIPFSIGDLLVAALIFLILFTLIRLFRLRLQGKKSLPLLKNSFVLFIHLALWAYAFFYLLWGLNYYRLGSSYLLGISPDRYTTAEVEWLTDHLDKKIRQICADSSAVTPAKTNDRKSLSKTAKEAYGAAQKEFPFMDFETVSLKPNLLGPLQSYTGYGGYLFPLTGEAHVNFYSPQAGLPFTVCHEMAHQIGFGTESEANLVGFLAAKSSPNPAFRYSAYTSMFEYALSELFSRDSIQAKSRLDRLPGYYKRDMLELREFVQRHKNPFQPLLNRVYNLYLMSNNQPEGIESYNYVVAWLIDYAKKYGIERL
ncbi:MAG: DUF3810 domain-containing protein [Chitinophagaceae bacterium]|nr:DUF3810 domain-containing protein [Chitinophagaceae bacterium]